MSVHLVTADGVGAGLPDPPDGPVIAVLPGDDIALHRLVLAETSPARRIEEARLRSVDLAAQPVDDLHVAVGPADQQGESWVALIDRQRMAEHLAHIRQHLAEPAHVVPAALLLAPGDGPRFAQLDDKLLVRTDRVAGLVEPELARLLTGLPALPRLIAGFTPAIDEQMLPLDLLQDAFAPRIRWWRARRFLVPAILLGLLALLLAAAPFAITQVRAIAAIAGYDATVVGLAQATLGRRMPDATTAAAALAAARRAAEGPALAARLAHATASIEPVPGGRLDAVLLLPDGQLRLALGGPADAMNRAAEALLAGPFDARRDGTTILLGDRRAGVAATPSALSEAMLRLATARADAALLAARPPGGKPPGTVDIAVAFEAAGLSDAKVLPAPAGTAITVPAARATVLLPLLADLELRGTRFTSLAIARNQDQTVNASAGVAQ